jgi:hypothetical protein
VNLTLRDPTLELWMWKLYDRELTERAERARLLGRPSSERRLRAATLLRGTGDLLIACGTWLRAQSESFEPGKLRLSA